MPAENSCNTGRIPPYKVARSGVLEDFERCYVTRLLSDAGGNVALAARRAQMDRTYLIKLIQRHGLRPRDYSSSSADDNKQSADHTEPSPEQL